MRVSSLQAYTAGLSAILESQSTVNRTQQQVATGRRVLTPADDPIASTKILQLQQDIAKGEQYQRNMIAAENRLQLEEKTLGKINDIMTRLQELTVSAGTGTLTITDRQAMASEVNQIKQSMANLFNSKDSSGEHIFGGFKGREQPFQLNKGGRYEYQGDDGQRFLAISDSATIATGDSGKALFVDVRAAQNTFNTQVNPTNTGSLQVNAGFVVDQDAFSEVYPDDIIITFNQPSAVIPANENYTVRRASDGRIIDSLSNMGYQPGTDVIIAGTKIEMYGDPDAGDQILIKSSPKQSILDTVVRLEQGLNNLKDTPADQDILGNLLNDTLLNLENAQSSVSETRAHVGARLNTIDNTRLLADDVALVNEEILSELSDIDFAAAVSKLSFESFLLEAAQQSYTTISRLSIFNSM